MHQCSYEMKKREGNLIIAVVIYLFCQFCVGAPLYFVVMQSCISLRWSLQTQVFYTLTKAEKSKLPLGFDQRSVWLKKSSLWCALNIQPPPS